MKNKVKLLGIFLIFFSANSHAGLISVDASADMSSGLPLTTNLLPIGTNVTADIQFDVGVGAINTSSFSNISGGFSWFDTAFGQQTFSADSAQITTINSSGWFDLNFTGIGPVINGIAADSFSILFDLGANPFLSPGSTTELYDLILNSSVSGMRVGAFRGGLTHYGNLNSNVTGVITAVPEPNIIILLLSGLLGLFILRALKRSSNN